MMNWIEAQAQAVKQWGVRGAAKVVPQRSALGVHLGYYYAVGLTSLNSTLGGPIMEKFGTSRVSFENAFAEARTNGYGPPFNEESGVEEE